MLIEFDKKAILNKLIRSILIFLQLYLLLMFYSTYQQADKTNYQKIHFHP